MDGCSSLHSFEPGTRRIARDSCSVWITQVRDPRDIPLGPGEQFLPAAERRSIAYALPPSRLTVAG